MRLGAQVGNRRRPRGAWSVRWQEAPIPGGADRRSPHQRLTDILRALVWTGAEPSPGAREVEAEIAEMHRHIPGRAARSRPLSSAMVRH